MLGVVQLRLVRIILVLMGLLIFGSMGYMVLEGWDFSDGFFMTIITLSTVGYGETHELSQHGRWFTSALILLCFTDCVDGEAQVFVYIGDNNLSVRNRANVPPECAPAGFSNEVGTIAYDFIIPCTPCGEGSDATPAPSASPPIGSLPRQGIAFMRRMAASVNPCDSIPERAVS